MNKRFLFCVAFCLALSGITAQTQLSMAQSNDSSIQSNWKTDLEEYENLNLKEPGNFNTLINLGRLKAWNKEYDAAKGFYNQAINLASSSSEKFQAKLGLGEVYSWQNKYDQAEDIYHAMRYEYPDSPEPVFRLAQVKLWQSKVKEAKKLYEENLKRFPEHNPSKLGLAKALSWLGKYARAEKIYDEIGADENNNPAYWTGVGENLAWSNRLLDSKKTLKQALTRFPDSDELAAAYFETTRYLGKPDEEVFKQGNISQSNLLSDLKSDYDLSLRPAVQSVYTRHTEAGTVDEKLKYNRIGTGLLFYPTDDSRLDLLFEPTFFSSGQNIDHEERYTYGAGFNKQWTDRIGTVSQFRIGDYSNEGDIDFYANLSLNMRPNDVWQPALEYLRYPIDESLMSSTGLRPVVGPLAGAIAGRVVRNEWWWHNTVNLPKRTSLKLHGALGVDTGHQITDNFFWKIEYQLEHEFGKTVMPNWTNTWYGRFEGRHWHFEDDRLNNGGAFLVVLPFGLPLGSDSVSPVPTSTNPGTGGYFSPDRYLYQAIRLGSRGDLWKKRLIYDLSGFIGYQDISRFGTDLAGGIQCLATLNVTDRFSVLAGINYDNTQQFAQTTFFSGLKLRL